MSINEKSKEFFLGRGALLLTTLIWGSSFVVLKNTINTIPTFYVLAFRFTGAAVILLFAGIKKLKELDAQHLKHGVIMGVFLFIAYAFQTYGLEQTSPGKNAFLTTTYCIIVPFLYWAVAGKRPHRFNVIAATICMIGVGFVSIQRELSINMGDVLTICCGLFFAMHIVATNKYVDGKSILMLTVVQLATAGALSWIGAVLTNPFPRQFETNHIWSMLYLCLMCTAACYALQTYGQKHTPPSSTALIMTLESVFGVIISVALGYEHLTLPIVVGFVLIFIAVLISETKLDFLKKKRGV